MIGTCKMFSRRATFILVAVGMFLGTMLLISSRLNDACPGGQFCPPDLGTIRDKFHGVHPNKDDAPPKKPTSTPTTHVTSKPPKVGDSGSGPNPEKAADKPDTPIEGETDQPLNHQPKNDPECADFPDTSNVLVIMKTGASEAYSKVPTQVLTNARCLPEFLIFSDMDQKIAGYHVRDSLDNVTPEVMKHKDFDIYWHQKECAVDQGSCNKNYDVKKKGWDLDKYKNVHVAEKTWHLRPNYDWYLYIDVDTYVVWSTMAKWLKMLNPKQPQYLGSTAYLSNMAFGHGGSGYLVSNAAMKKMFDGKKDVAREYDMVAKGTCCGDYVFAKALKDKIGLSVQNMWPTINGEKPHTIPYEESSWCQPIATMHHVSAEELSDIDAFERGRNTTEPLRIKDMYEHFIRDNLPADRDEWDNLTDDRYYLNPDKHYDSGKQGRAKEPETEEEKNAHKSFEECRIACLSLDYCLQFKYDSSYCAMTNKFKHGGPLPREKPTDGSSHSGWDLESIKKWVNEQKECKDYKWPGH